MGFLFFVLAIAMFWGIGWIIIWDARRHGHQLYIPKRNRLIWEMLLLLMYNYRPAEAEKKSPDYSVYDERAAESEANLAQPAEVAYYEAPLEPETDASDDDDPATLKSLIDE